MKPDKLYLISPREPSGATWLINCLLELGIKTYRETLGEMWEPSRQGGYTLNPVEKHLKKWLPILSSRETFQFREDIEVEWAHHWPTVRHRAHRIIYFVRDPRDALLSRYRRESPEMSFGEFLDFPDPYTLRNKIDTWCLFNEVWLQQPNLVFFRFEDYKQNANRTLENILRYVGVRAEEHEFLSALENSAFEKAAIAERKYREQHPEDNELINRASQVGAWQSLNETGNVTRIAEDTKELLAHFGYGQQIKPARKSYFPQARVLDFYKRLPVKADFWQTENETKDISVNKAEVEQFVLSLDEDKLKRSGISAYETFALLRGLEEFTLGVDGTGIQRIQWLRNCLTIKPWWRVIRAMEKYDIHLPFVRTSLWRVKSFFRKNNGVHTV